MQYYMLGNCGIVKLKPISIIHNRLLKFVSNSPLRTNINRIYLNMRILKLDDIFNLELAKFMYSFNKGLLPKSFFHYFNISDNVSALSTRNISNNIYNTPLYNKCVG